MFVRIAATALLAALLVGCSSAPPARTEAVDVTVAVTLPNGQPAKDVTLNLFPTSSEQVQTGGKTDASGKVSTKAVPGKYTFGFEGNPASVPKKYHSNDAAHVIEVPTGGSKDLTIKLTN
jgi:hypothetical protein